MAQKRRKNSAFFSAASEFLNTVGYILFVVGLSLAISTVAILAANDVLALVKKDKDVTLTISEDISAEEMSQLLADKEVINYKFLFDFILKFKRVDTFEKGTFELNSNMDYGQIMQTLQRKQSGSVVKVTIPEGYTMQEIAQLMEDSRVCSADAFIETADTYDFSHEALKDVPLEKNRLEGYLFPDTYEFYVNENTVSVINKMLNNFEKRYTQAMRELTEKNGKSIGEILILASLIEKEAQWASERTIISGVIKNRLADPGNFPYLQIDATIMYVVGHKEKLTVEDLALDSPYNTYVHGGLPPTPICNPGLSSILAAISPEENGYYYYVVDPETGGHIFSKTLAEHQAAIARVTKK